MSRWCDRDQLLKKGKKVLLRMQKKSGSRFLRVLKKHLQEFPVVTTSRTLPPPPLQTGAVVAVSCTETKLIQQWASAPSASMRLGGALLAARSAISAAWIEAWIAPSPRGTGTLKCLPPLPLCCATWSTEVMGQRDLVLTFCSACFLGLREHFLNLRAV